MSENETESVNQANTVQPVIMVQYSPQGFAGVILLQPTEQAIQEARQDDYMMPDEYDQWLKA